MVERTTGRVGPVLICGEYADAVLAAIRAENTEVQAHDRDGYLRISVNERCCVTRVRIERELGRRFELPRDLEAIMPAFKGKLRLDADSVSWER